MQMFEYESLLNTNFWQNILQKMMEILASICTMFQKLSPPQKKNNK